MASISKTLRTTIIERANGLCEYCQTSQLIVLEMEIDHIQPESKGGLTTESNLCLACAGCNGFKSDAEEAIDPETRQKVPLFNPRTQNWPSHFGWSPDGTLLIGRTATGRATIERLLINRELVVKARERWVKAGWHPPKN
jgi:hypothetical protein